MSSAPGLDQQLDENGEPQFLDQVKLFLSRAAKKTDISEEMYNVIESCNSIIKFNIGLKMDSGEIKTVECFRA